MIASERHRIILQELEERGNVSAKELKARLQVSIDTVRRDLELLEQINKLKRVHGGAIILDEQGTNHSFLRRTVTHLQRKQKVAETAMSLILENQAIALNAGTTNIEVAKQLVEHFNRLTIITNSLKVAEVLANNRNFTIIMPGGILNAEEYSLYGRTFEQEISQFNIDVAFIAINAISLEKGLTDFRQGESEVINAMLRFASQKVVVADSSKFETVSYLNICPIRTIDTIVTDSELDPRIKQSYQEQGVNIIVSS